MKKILLTAAAVMAASLLFAAPAGQQPETTEVVYTVGAPGPAGGIVFYDKGNESGGWRYLEAAPVETEGTLAFWVDPYTNGYNANLMDQTKGRTLGDGVKNTRILMADFNANGGGFGTAIRHCDALVSGGVDDWFLPSLDELNWMYGHLYMQGLAGLTNEQYWSSTTNSYYFRAFVKDFSTNGQLEFDHDQYNNNNRKVRCVRMFR
ncbi:MAG: DUF1566 domain-containing protein [Alistipes sp.]|jgi:hypothetical protein|nr:DUF1566 domain-containing protein [Alistipes sp.]